MVRQHNRLKEMQRISKPSKCADTQECVFSGILRGSPPKRVKIDISSLFPFKRTQIMCSV